MRTIMALLLTLVASTAYSGDDVIDFESDRWEIQSGKVVDHLGQKAFMGRALLKNIDFQNGVIEVDMAFEGSRSFAGILFRAESNDNLENFYIRPHKSNLPDALQYHPVINGSSTWQIYSDEGFTAPAPIPHKSWLHVKMEISGTQARVYLDNQEKPSLVVTDLKHGSGTGAIGVSGPPNGLAHFANFRYRLDDELDFETASDIRIPPRHGHGLAVVPELQAQRRRSGKLPGRKNARCDRLGTGEKRKVGSPKRVALYHAGG